MAETIDKVIVNKISKAYYDELVLNGTITPAMIREQTWIFTDDQYVSSADKSNWNSKQDALISGTNIKTINNQSLLGSGDLIIDASGLDFKGYIKNQNYINLKKLDLGMYYVMEGTTYSLIDNPGPNQRRMFNNYAIYLLTGYNLIINKNIDEVAVGEVFAYAFGLIRKSDGIAPQYVEFTKSASTSTYGFGFNIIESVNYIKSGIMDLNSPQTVTGVKTFTALPESSVTPTTNTQLVNKKYVDDSIPIVPTDVSAFNNDAGYITGISSADVTTALGYTPVNSSIVGVADGIAELDSTGKVPSAQLPSFVDDVIEGYYNTADHKFYEESTYTTEIPGESGKIYVDLTTNKTYRWGGSTFVEISESLALGTTSTTAFRGDLGEEAYLHSQSAHAPANAEPNVIDSISVNNTVVVPDANKNVNIDVPTEISELNNDAGYITGMTILSYGHSTWNDFLTAYRADRVVYCRASSNSNPGTGAQNRLAFMAYLNNATSPTEVEFQYYRSVSSHSDSQQGDQMYVYKINSSGTWTVTVRNSFSKVVAGTNMSSSYSNGTITLNNTFNDTITTTATVPNPIILDTITQNTAYCVTGLVTANVKGTTTNTETKSYSISSEATSLLVYNNYATANNGDIVGINYQYNLGTRGSDTTTDIEHKIIYLIKDTTSNSGLSEIEVIDKKLSNVLNLRSHPTINYQWTFNTLPKSTTIPTTADDLVNKKYVENLLAIDYDTTSTYAVGDYVYYDNKLYVCNTNITVAEDPFDATHWTEITPNVLNTVNTLLATKQDTLVSGTNIKTINNQSLLGSGNIDIQGGGGASIYDLTDIMAITLPSDQTYTNILADIQAQKDIRIYEEVTTGEDGLYTVVRTDYDGTTAYLYYFDKENKYTTISLTDDGTDATVTKVVNNDFLFYNKALNSESVSGWGADRRCWINSNQWATNKFVMEGKPTGLYLFDAIATYSGSFVPQKIKGSASATGTLDVLGLQFMIILKDYTSASVGETLALWWGEGRSGPQYGTLRKQNVNSAYPAGLQLGNDNNSFAEIYVNLLDGQTINGVKTFTSLPKSGGIPSAAEHLVNKKYAENLLAADYSTSSTYAVGDYVYYSNKLYVCNTAIPTAESWTVAHWTQITPNALNIMKDYVDSHSGGSSKYVGTITGDGTTTSFTITHNLSSRDVIVQVYDNATYATVLVDVTRNTTNTVQIDFATAPIVDKVYKVIVM